MGSLSLAEAISAIHDTLKVATGIVRTQDFDKLTEGMPPGDLPLFQVYPESGVVSRGSDSDRHTFGAGVRQWEWVIHVDVYGSRRKELGQDMGRLVAAIDAIDDELAKQTAAGSRFGEIGIKSFEWEWSRVIFKYGSNNEEFVGARFIITLVVF